MTRADIMQLALDALLSCHLYGDGWTGPHQAFDEVKVQNAITALKKALGEEQ